MNTIRFIDVETPNQHQDRVCQIGMIQTDLSGNIICEKSTLVNPEAKFFWANIKVHGIHQRDVADSPTFAEIWNEYFGCEPEIALVAHNASFDLSVISKTLNYYGIKRPTIYFADTKQMSKYSQHSFPSAKLTDICQVLGIPISRHHDAFCDAKCCCDVYWRLYDGKHNFSKYDSDLENGYIDKSSLQKDAYCQFRELTQSVISDGLVTEAEARQLIKLIAESNELMNERSSAKALVALQYCIEDGYIDPIESEQLVSYLSSCL